MHILFSGDLGDNERDAWLEALRNAVPDARWHLAVEPANAGLIEAAVVANPLPGSLQGLPRLRLIQSLWAGVDRLMSDDSLPPGVPIARMVDPAMSAAMAETALWATLSLHRDFFRYARLQQQGAWQPLPQRRADEIRVTVLGFGEMGRGVARRLAAQGYRVAAWKQHEGAAEQGVALHTGSATLPPLLGQSDVVINLLPLTVQTRGLLNREFFAAMPPGSSLVNLGRGAHLVEADLLEVLDSGRIGHAVLDVFEHEPLPGEHPFWRHPRVTLLPHVAAQTDRRSATQVVASNLAALRSGRPLAHLVSAARGY